MGFFCSFMVAVTLNVQTCRNYYYQKIRNFNKLYRALLLILILFQQTDNKCTMQITKHTTT